MGIKTVRLITSNTAYGVDSMNGAALDHTTADDGVQNTALGTNTLKAITTGQNNTAVGYNALTAITTGEFNTAIGCRAGDVLTTGTYNILIGDDVDASANNASYEINIGGVIKGSWQSGSEKVSIPLDNAKLLLGQAEDASLYYDGTDLCIDSSEVGSGTIDLKGQSATSVTTETLSEYITLKINGVSKKIAIVA